MGIPKPRKDEVQYERLQLRDDDVWVLPKEHAEHVQHPVITIQNAPTIFILAYNRRAGLNVNKFERSFTDSHIGARRPDVRWLIVTVQEIDKNGSSGKPQTGKRTKDSNNKVLSNLLTCK